tara:strand:+ start:584 stop:811 length:228 start_codon:yes stop_codon:yes gene_type:complete
MLKRPHTPEHTPRELEAFRLRKEANGEKYAPAKKGSFFEKKRKDLVDEYVRKGLEVYDLAQEESEDELMFVLDLF